MKGKENLIPFSKRSKEEARNCGKRGGEASGRARREKRAFKDLIELAFSIRMKDEEGNEVTHPETGKPMSRKEAAAVALVERCADGDLKAIDLAAELLGEKIVKAEVETVRKDTRTLDEINAEIEKLQQLEKMAQGK